jgi:hypothetical protein
LTGRIDNAAHDAAVAKVSGAIPYKNEILSCLKQILASSEFRSSHRCQDFLSHVVKHALSGDFDEIKERILGIRVFGREAGYDTNYDSIVRVTASGVRKRLLRYYKTSGSSAIRIELPAGSYIPEFHYNIGEAAHSPVTIADSSSVPESDAIRDRSDEVVATSSDQPVLITKSGKVPSEWSDKAALRSPALHIRLLHFALVTSSLCLVFLVVGWRVGTLHAKPGIDRGSYADSKYLFYKELLGPIATDPRQDTKIVLSNPLLFLYRGSGSPTPASDADRGEKKIPIPQRLASNFTGGSDDPQVEFPYHYLALDTTDYTGLGEAQTAFSLQKLFEVLNRSAQLTEARFLHWDEARDQHLVLLGARHMNPWTQDSVITANFKMDRNVITNAHPKPGERPFYAAKFDGGVLEDYGLIWMSQSPSGSRILVLAGLTSTGTAGVGGFFVDPNRMKLVFEKLKAASGNSSLPTNWQVLVRITARDDVPIEVSFVTLRISNAYQGGLPRERQIPAE